ncbi:MULTISPECIES: LysM peptidoglycan-binding domain-containing protein [Geobacillus]|uniref:LysM domain-containing protein n=2 Tax=Geobacillus TaxID=129337 RepID=A0A3L7CXQ6_GEOSE|nr:MULTISPECIES: LysM domain-containing protein [Geobacillus]AWO74976.1 LysM domain-containing protein [Geobacillus thermoleovorans]MBW7642550.1 LysM peptidoglycan-binding domain-containing protein [Geobacillus thermoleovorans]MED4333321.1 LysM domain-containing protein [Geobacillus stearothermophilus]MED4995886.1 LysM domain-containing protein [Geobacillus stearothermophilus]OPX04961.1 peptidoglycan-binding protein [Geobacillus sp. LEMMY01]
MTERAIYFVVNDREFFRLPVNPEKVNVKEEGDGEEFTIASLGKVNVPKPAKLKSFTLESYFPAQPTHYSATVFKKPKDYIRLLEKWLNHKQPVRYIYVNGPFTINELVTIERFEYDESFGSEDVNFSLELKKYVPFGPKKMKIAKAKNGTKQIVKKNTPTRQNTKPKPTTYTLKRGDSLWKVAQYYTGSGHRYRELQKLNGIKDSQLRRLPIGLVLKIPPDWVK